MQLAISREQAHRRIAKVVFARLRLQVCNCLPPVAYCLFRRSAYEIVILDPKHGICMTPDKDNIIFQFATELVNHSSRNIFLTGKAGTGKTTFLKYIREHSTKKIAVVAPTGVAAINAGGVTIHSFFQLPLSPFIPASKGFGRGDETVDRHALLSRLRMNNDKKKVLRELELLVIDEISMVRCDVLDAIDTVLRHIRNNQAEVFGGVQVLFIGDMFQLPPVVKEPEWSILSEYYNSPYFFDSIVMHEDKPLYIEFTKIYRQSEEQFIRVLNQVRNNQLDEEGLQILEARLQPNFRRSKDDGYIILTTHNESARNTNTSRLQELNTPLYSYSAEVQDEFPESAYPAEEVLNLKEGAQVMFIKNDPERAKRFFNGKIGTVTRLEKDKIFVRCQDDSEEIEVKKEKWDNIRYEVNKTTRDLEPIQIGSFSQYPLRLAWAITIHKSQGLTFEKAIIDAGKSFAAGQVYVALSRCTSLEGMVLQSRINTASIQNDPKIVEFSRNSASESRLKQELDFARSQYRKKLLLELFDFQKALQACRELCDYTREHYTSFSPDTLGWLEMLSAQVIAQQETANKFQLQLQKLFAGNDDALLQERIRAGAGHFYKEMRRIIQLIAESPASTDSKMHAKEYNDYLKEVLVELALKTQLLEGEDGTFDLDNYHRRKRAFNAPALPVNSYSGSSQQSFADVPNPKLHQQLRKTRDSICQKKDLPVYLVAGTKTLLEMATYLPLTLEELNKINGFGEAKIAAYGQQFLDVIIQYAVENGLSSKINEKVEQQKKEKKEKAAKEPKAAKQVKVNTKEETFKLYKQGMTADAIAKERMLTIQTIEGHLAFYVEKGEISIDELVNPGRREMIEPILKDFDGNGGLTGIREKLNNEVGYGEIRLVIAWTHYKRQQELSGSE